MSNLETLQAGTDTIYGALAEPEAKALVHAALERRYDEDSEGAHEDKRFAADLAVEFGLDNAIGRDAAVTAIRAVQGRE